MQHASANFWSYDRKVKSAWWQLPLQEWGGWSLTLAPAWYSSTWGPCRLTNCNFSKIICHYLFILRSNVSKRKSNPISLMKSLPIVREVRKWQHAMTQIWKRNWEGASKVTAPIRITRWHTWERFWSRGYEQLHKAPVTQALLGIGQQDAQTCFNSACWPEGGLDPGPQREVCGQIQTLPSVESQSAVDTIMKAH